MIARTWRGRATREHAPAYVEHFRHTLLPHFAALPGYRDAYLLQRQSDDGVELTAITLWESMDAVRDFAGDDPEVAIVEPAARAVLTDYDRHVTHDEVVAGPMRS